MKKGVLWNILVNLLAIVVLIWIFFPIYNMLVTSFKTYQDIWKTTYLPPTPTIEPYIVVLTQRYWRMNYFWIWLWNSLRISFMVMFLAVGVGSLTGYSLSTRCSLGRKTKSLLGTLTLFTYIFPSSILSIPIYILLRDYGLLDSDIGLALALSVLVIPFNAWMAAEYFDKIPKEINEAATIDGASRMTIFLRILLPLAIPAIIALSVYSFMYSWNSYLYPLLIINTEIKFPLPLGMSSFLASDDSPWNIFMATSILYALPAVIVYYAFKKYLIAGLFRGAVKA